MTADKLKKAGLVFCIATLSRVSLALDALPQSEPAPGESGSRDMVRALEAYAVYKLGQHELAFERFSALADEGHIQGILNVANMYAEGFGTAPDQAMATHWYRQGALDGSEIGMRAYGERLEAGIGVTADPVAAARWLERADRQARWEAGPPLTGKPVQPGATQLAVLDALDDAAMGRSATGMVAPLGDDTRILIATTATGTWTEITRSTLASLWQSGFSRPGVYHYARTNIRGFRGDDGSIVVSSRILERWNADDATHDAAPVFALGVTETIVFTSEDDGGILEMWIEIQEDRNESSS